MASSCLSVGGANVEEEPLRDGLLDADGREAEADELADGLAEGVEEASVSPDVLELLPFETLGEFSGSP
jgi:hypothetical protein